MGIFPPVWLVEDEGRWWPAWCPEAGAFWCGFHFLRLPPLRFDLRYVWWLVERVSPFEEEGRGTGSWVAGSEETVRLSTTRGADEPRDCSDKVEDCDVQCMSGGSSSLRGGRTDDRWWLSSQGLSLSIIASVIASSDNKAPFKKSCDKEDGISSHSGREY